MEVVLLMALKYCNKMIKYISLIALCSVSSCNENSGANSVGDFISQIELAIEQKDISKIENLSDKRIKISSKVKDRLLYPSHGGVLTSMRLLSYEQSKKQWSDTVPFVNRLTSDEADYVLSLNWDIQMDTGTAQTSQYYAIIRKSGKLYMNYIE